MEEGTRAGARGGETREVELRGHEWVGAGLGKVGARVW